MEIIFKKIGNMSKYDIIQRIFKCCVSKMCFIVLLPNVKGTYNQIDPIEKIFQSSLLQIDPFPTINNWLSLHTREWEQRGRLWLDQVYWCPLLSSNRVRTSKTSSPHQVPWIHSHQWKPLGWWERRAGKKEAIFALVGKEVWTRYCQKYSHTSCCLLKV